MQHNPVELDHVAAAEGHGRVDLYIHIHKALRAFMADTLLAVGRMDPTDAAEWGNATDRVDALMAFCAAHLAHENMFIHAALEARAPGSSAAVADDHVSHLDDIAALQAAGRRVRVAADHARPAAALALYRELSRFVGHNFEHMLVEEVAHNAALWATHTDAELVSLHQALVASIPPEEMMQVLRWMLPALSATERAGMLAEMRAEMPPPVFEAVLDLARTHLDQRNWGKLARALGLPCVAGLTEA